jgi:hypothetical protein
MRSASALMAPRCRPAGWTAIPLGPFLAFDAIVTIFLSRSLSEG